MLPCGTKLVTNFIGIIPSFTIIIFLMSKNNDFKANGKGLYLPWPDFGKSIPDKDPDKETGSRLMSTWGSTLFSSFSLLCWLRCTESRDLFAVLVFRDLDTVMILWLLNSLGSRTLRWIPNLFSKDHSSGKSQNCAEGWNKVGKQYFPYQLQHKASAHPITFQQQNSFHVYLEYTLALQS